MSLEQWLEKLNDIISPEHVEASRDLQLKSLSFEEAERLPTFVHFPAPQWPSFPYKAAFEDREKMLLNELAGAWIGALGRDDRMYTIRANYGVGIIPSMFGCEITIVNEIQMPWVEPLDDRQLEKAISNGVPDLTNGLGGRVLKTEQFYLDTLSKFDNLAQTVHVYCCDIQGPFDLAHLIMGHRIYTDVLDNPELVHAVLDVVTDTFIAFAKEQRKLIGEKDGFHFHSNHFIPGGVRLCDDSPTNLSAGMYREFCKPYNDRAFAELGGGWVHYCGEARQILPEVLSVEGITGINFGNPEKQDAEAMFRAAAKKKVAVIGWPREVPEWVKTGVTVVRSAKDLDEARMITSACAS